MSIGISKKPPLMTSPEFGRLFSKISKAALIDVLWCASQLGTDESPEQIAAQAARNAVIALEARGDRIPADLRTISEQPIDSD